MNESKVDNQEKNGCNWEHFTSKIKIDSPTDMRLLREKKIVGELYIHLSKQICLVVSDSRHKHKYFSLQYHKTRDFFIPFVFCNQEVRGIQTKQNPNFLAQNLMQSKRKSNKKKRKMYYPSNELTPKASR